MDHFNDLLEVLDFYQLNVMQAQGVDTKQKKNEGAFIKPRIIGRLMNMTLDRLSKDQDLTLSIVNLDTNKTLNPCLPHLFQPSCFS